MTGFVGNWTLPPIPAEPQIRSAFLQRCASALRELDVSLDRFAPVLSLEGAGVEDPDAWVPLQRLEDLLEEGVTQLGDPCLALRMGLHYDLRELGALGFVLLNSPTVAVAAENLTRYYRIKQTGSEVEFSRDDRHFKFTYRVLDPALSNAHRDAEHTLGMFISGMSAFTNGGFHPEEIHFRQATPSAAGQYQDLLPDTVIRFGQPRDAVLANADVANRSIEGADDHLLPVLEEHLAPFLPRRSGDDEVLTRLEEAVGRSFHTSKPSIAHVARTMGIGTRTLQRRLVERGVTFQETVNRIRENLARQHVAAGDLSLSEIAFLLGYSEQSTFGRAFRRWTGETPLEFRKHGEMLQH